VWACLSPAEWLRLYTAQHGQCAICLSPLRNRYDPQDTTKCIANLDHLHARERELLAAGIEPSEALRRSLRGLLCGWDNRYVLQVLHDDPEKAQRAADYLTHPPARVILKLDVVDT